MYTVEGTVLIQSSRTLVRILMFMESLSSFKLGPVGQKTRSLGKILEGAVLIQTYETV